MVRKVKARIKDEDKRKSKLKEELKERKIKVETIEKEKIIEMKNPKEN